MLVFGIICIFIMLVAFAMGMKSSTVEHRNVIFGGREFEIDLSPELNGSMCAVVIYEVVHPHRKIFRTKYRCYKTFWISDFETIKQGMYAMIESYLIDEEEENNLAEKWKEIDNG